MDQSELLVEMIKSNSAEIAKLRESVGKQHRDLEILIVKCRDECRQENLALVREIHALKVRFATYVGVGITLFWLVTTLGPQIIPHLKAAVLN